MLKSPSIIVLLFISPFMAVSFCLMDRGAYNVVPEVSETVLLSFHSFIFFFNFILFYFLTLQYCIGFAIYQHASTTGIHVFPILNPPPSPYHPSGSSQCTSPKHPVSCIEPGLATRFIYDIIHVSMPFSQVILPSPSPTESKRLFYTSMSLLLSPTQGYCYHLSKFHIYALVYCIGVLGIIYPNLVMKNLKTSEIK